MSYKKELLKKYLEKKEDSGWIAKSGQGIYRSFQFQFIFDLIKQYLPPENSLILDIGIDPGNFALKLAQLNRRLIISDISDEQLKIVREKFENNKLQNKIEQFAVLDDLVDLSIFNNETFDFVLCLAGTISYTCDKRQKFVNELVRITKSGSPIVISAKTKSDYFKHLIKEEKIAVLEDAIKEGLWEFAENGFKQYDEESGEAAYYAFSARELIELLSNVECEILELTALTPISNNFIKEIIKVRESEEAWNTLLELEKRLGKSSGLLESSEEIIIIARKKFI